MSHTDPGAKGTILVVEDNEELRDLAVAILSRLGYRAIEAEDAPSALRLLAMRRRRIDLVFSDVCMPPHMNGFELAEEVGRRYPDIGVLLTSGRCEVRLDATACAAAGVKLLPKPYRMADLALAVHDAMNVVRRAEPDPNRK